jgi:hypothetical protein
MRMFSFQSLKFSALLNSATDIISNALARLIYAGHELLVGGESINPNLETRAAVARSKTVIGELEAQRRADDSRPLFQSGTR